MKRLQYLLLAILGIMLLMVIIFGIYNFSNITRQTYNINDSSPAVIKQLQALNRYETASFTIEKIIDAGTSGSDLNQLLFGDRLLLIAHGKVVAGFDFSDLTPDSIIQEKNSVTLTLPRPEILETKLDSGQTRVYDRRTGLLTRGDKDLESKARNAAEQSVMKAACEGNILEEAAKNGKAQLTALLRTLGFTLVIINIPAAHC